MTTEHPDAPTPAFRHFLLPASGRRLACTEQGPQDAGTWVVCLPGLLETRASFAPLLQQLQAFDDCRVLAVDPCGRGDSDPLPAARDYTMSVYLDDLTAWLQDLLQARAPHTRLHLLGTSMGGLLAMYLVPRLATQVHGLVFNDITPSLHWTSLMALYKDMGAAAGQRDLLTLAQDLRVHPHVIEAIRSPAHFDLPHRVELWGMRFDEQLQGFAGPVALVHGLDSVLCNRQQVAQFKRLLPQLNSLPVPGAGHPVPWSAAVCEWVAGQLGLARRQALEPVQAWASSLPTWTPGPLPPMNTEPEPVKPLQPSLPVAKERADLPESPEADLVVNADKRPQPTSVTAALPPSTSAAPTWRLRLSHRLGRLWSGFWR